ncbi:MAG: hypothetical protein EZS28_003530 [Streblomastix strix]|uniref:TRAFD1/XAF1 zinc finger domain-containing protein n=1 Tax=Streblomastix strix TaxID=222440 RepID=A0A5J4X2H2_9EUKA|nr:MAG: hypothetical protein EZS28_003530 [Streblomastix strix]
MSAIICEGRTCENCKQIIESNFDAHEIFCRRNITLCLKCNELVQKRAFDEHDREVHKLVKCEKCDIDIDQYFIDQHSTDECALRIVGLCPYCKIELIPSTLYSHQEECGARTDECQICGARIRNRDMENHILSNCEDLTLKQQQQDQGYNDMEFFNQPSSFFPEQGMNWELSNENLNNQQLIYGMNQKVRQKKIPFQSTPGYRLGSDINEDQFNEGGQKQDYSKDLQSNWEINQQKEKIKADERFNQLVAKQKQKIDSQKSQLDFSNNDYVLETADVRKNIGKSHGSISNPRSRGRGAKISPSKAPNARGRGRGQTSQKHSAITNNSGINNHIIAGFGPLGEIEQINKAKEKEVDKKPNIFKGRGHKVGSNKLSNSPLHPPKKR